MKGFVLNCFGLRSRLVLNALGRLIQRPERLRSYACEKLAAFYSTNVAMIVPVVYLSSIDYDLKIRQGLVMLFLTSG
jgi:hypothetical protein